MKFTLENTQQYSSLQLLNLWCDLCRGHGRVPSALGGEIDKDYVLAHSFLQAVARWPQSLETPYDVLCEAQALAGLDQPPIDCSCDTLGQLWILCYEIEKGMQHHSSGSSLLSRPFISASIHIHRTKENTTTVSALYVDFDDEDLMKMVFPPVTRVVVKVVDRYLKAANAKLISDDMDVINKNMVPELGQMLGWLLLQPQVKPLLDLVAQEVVN